MLSYCCFSSDAFNLTTEFSYPVFFCPFHAPLDVVVPFPIFLRSFRFESFLFQFSPFVTQIKTFCSDPCYFRLTVFAKDLTGCFSHCCVEGGGHQTHVYVFITHDGERCNLPPIMVWRVSNTLGSFSFSLFRRRWKVIIRKSLLLSISGPGKLRVLAMFTPDRKRFLTRM